ncbi:hypothetical protein REH65_33435 (plasmid) [Saccharopolyspora sp. ID03-671]|uniref:hypothetical protein n=1 Tax=Saccharopolyspora sp. ID03-671 TaxID=3073066 RepID=UPI0030F441A9
MAEIDGQHACGPLPDPAQPGGSFYTCECGLGFMYVPTVGWKCDDLFAGEPSEAFKARND